MRYLPYAAASSGPNVIVDGTANDRTLVTLSHWRQSGTPAELMADTSTAIVFNYLDRPDLHVPADVVSNNHFDEDGLVGIYALLDPAEQSTVRRSRRARVRCVAKPQSAVSSAADAGRGGRGQLAHGR